ncbi:efflux RND transporter periplasmic adaptor subunit [Labrys monachus]|uniref:Multidrug efflux system membrane fusion protein n=1 Tax=Labrys monachus TaxID=217067 RepID=A0ABU0FLY3_9HYPH|nr:efflux RND transporter periplasmic adaptor subunit [Labrys monachus]MDQ0395606.1 multidrug efflux system membrane fusion protein [Labrys monachus]
MTIVLVAAAAGYGGWRYYDGNQAQAQAASKAAPPVAKVPVTFVQVAKADFPVRTYGLGTVTPFKTATVKSRVDGQIIKVFFKQGQMVKEGDPLIEIDKRPYQSALDQALAKKAQDEANLRNDQLNLERFQNLAKQNFESKQNLDAQQALVDQMTAQIKGDQAAIDNAQTNLSYTTITAPFSGRTGFRLIDPGNIVHASDQTGMVTIAMLQPIAVVYTEPEDSLPAVSKAYDRGGVAVDALSSDGQTTLSHGALAVIDNSVNQATGTISLKARFDNKDNALWPGLSVTTRMLVDTLKQVVVVPEDVVQHGPGGLFAYVIDADGKVEAQPIKVGLSGDGKAVVTDGLAPGQKVVVEGQSRLQPGAEVDAKPMAADGEKVAEQAVAPADAAAAKEAN